MFLCALPIAYVRRMRVGRLRDYFIVEHLSPIAIVMVPPASLHACACICKLVGMVVSFDRISLATCRSGLSVWRFVIADRCVRA